MWKPVPRRLSHAVIPPELYRIYRDKPVGTMQREPDRLPAADAPDNGSSRKIHRLHPQVVQQVQPRAPGIFVERLLGAPDSGRQQRIAGQRQLGGG